MYSIKIAAKLVKIKQLYKKAEEQLSNFIVLSTYYLTFRVVRGFCSWATPSMLKSGRVGSIILLMTAAREASEKASPC